MNANAHELDDELEPELATVVSITRGRWAGRAVDHHAWAEKCRAIIAASTGPVPMSEEQPAPPAHLGRTADERA
jgi:hypothetical protein